MDFQGCSHTACTACCESRERYHTGNVFIHVFIESCFRKKLWYLQKLFLFRCFVQGGGYSQAKAYPPTHTATPPFFGGVTHTESHTKPAEALLKKKYQRGASRQSNGTLQTSLKNPPMVSESVIQAVVKGGGHLSPTKPWHNQNVWIPFSRITHKGGLHPPTHPILSPLAPGTNPSMVLCSVPEAHCQKISNKRKKREKHRNSQGKHLLCENQKTHKKTQKNCPPPPCRRVFWGLGRNCPTKI